MVLSGFSMKSGYSLTRRFAGISAGTPVFGKSTAIEKSFASSTHGFDIAFSGSLSAKTVWAFAMIPRLSLTM